MHPGALPLAKGKSLLDSRNGEGKLVRESKESQSAPPPTQCGGTRESEPVSHLPWGFRDRGALPRGGVG